MPETEDIDDGDVTWRFDTAFLTSRWTCTWGRGCLGILDRPAPELLQGCCSVGAQIDGEDEARRIAGLAATLDPDGFQFHGEADAGGLFEQREGAPNTRVVDGACIFLNRPGFPAGPGVGASASCAALARVFAPRCGASTIVMFRPSCLADVSMKPCSATSAPRRCNSR